MQFDAIQIQVNDLQKAYDFYHKLLGFTICSDTSSGITVRAGRTNLELYLSHDLQGCCHLAFHIPNNQLQKALNWVGEKVDILPTGDDQLVADFTNWNARSFYFRDPFDNILEIITHFDLKMQSKDFRGAQDITHVIEAGIVTQNVQELCKQLQNDFKFTFFDKGPVTENFAVIGDEEGMLIISLAGRHWFPTDQPAESIDMRLQITHGDKQITLATKDLQ